MRNKGILDPEIGDLIAKHRQALPALLTRSCKEAANVSVTENRIAMSVLETAVRLGLSPKSVERLIKKGEFNVKRAGRRVLIPVGEIESWLNRKD